MLIFPLDFNIESQILFELKKPAMGSKVLAALHGVQALLGLYNLYLASISIKNLHQYEEKSEKAAEWSNEAERQLHKTRTTQATGVLTVRLSFQKYVQSLKLIIRRRSSPSSAQQLWFSIQHQRQLPLEWQDSI